jgi:hypothetical protein
VAFTQTPPTTEPPPDTTTSTTSSTSTTLPCPEQWTAETLYPDLSPTSTLVCHHPLEETLQQGVMIGQASVMLVIAALGLAVFQMVRRPA